MIRDTIGKIEESLLQADTIKSESKAELMALLGTLRAEVNELSRTDADNAHSIAGFTAVSTHEATREEKNPQLFELSLKAWLPRSRVSSSLIPSWCMS